MRVACPECSAQRINPPEAYACTGCGRRLRWFPPSAFTTQLRLFTLGPWQQDELPVSGDPPPPAPAPAPIPSSAQRTLPAEQPTPVGPSPIDQLILDAIALIMAARLSGPGPGPAFAIGDLLYERSDNDLVEMVTLCAAFAGWAFDQLDIALEGLGTEFLQRLAMNALKLPS